LALATEHDWIVLDVDTVKAISSVPTWARTATMTLNETEGDGATFARVRGAAGASPKVLTDARGRQRLASE
jgi:hypothetical protein